MRKILFLRGGALGDFIVTLPALLSLRQRWPEAELELSGNTVAAQLAVNRGLIDKAHSQHEARWAALYDGTPLSEDFSRWLTGFDLVVSYWPDPDGDLGKRFPAHPAQRFISAAPMPATAPAAAHYAAALRQLDIAPRSHFCRIERNRIAFDEGLNPRPRGSRADWVAIHPGSGSPRKNWPAERWLELINRLKRPVLLILGEAETEAWKAAGGALSRRKQLRIASGLTLEQLVDELTPCGLFLGHDSGVSHLAAACGLASVLLFGPTEPAVWAPPAAHVRVLQRGRDLDAITVDEVMAAIMTAPVTL